MSFKAKRTRHKGKTGLSLPSGKQHKGIYNGMAVEIQNLDSIRDLQDNGCFGSLASRLLLFPEEAFYLAYALHALEISTIAGSPLSKDEVLQEFRRINPKFVSSFVAYSYLRSKNWVTKSGIKFGGDFLIYRRGPEYYHASYLVLVNTEGEKGCLTPVQLQCIDRVSRTSGKDVLILEVSPRDEGQPLQISDFTITEIIPKRFICK